MFRVLLYTVLLTLSACHSNRSVKDNIQLPLGKLYQEPEVVYKDEHTRGASCRIWH
jgi:hypothetical protein